LSFEYVLSLKHVLSVIKMILNWVHSFAATAYNISVEQVNLFLRIWKLFATSSILYFRIEAVHSSVHKTRRQIIDPTFSPPPVRAVA